MVVLLTDGLERCVEALKELPGASDKALRLALNETVKKGRTFVDREIRQTYAIKQRVPGSPDKGSLGSLKPIMARPDNLTGGIIAQQSMNPLIEFGVRPNRPQPARRPAIGVQVAKTGFKDLDVDGNAGFVAAMSSGHVGVFVRLKGKWMKHVGPRGGKRQFIKELFSIGTPFMMNAERLGEDKHKALLDYWNQRVDHHINLALKGEGPYKNFKR